jgi:DNA-directed RNA polymerase subunit RPC12/RpoP
MSNNAVSPPIGYYTYQKHDYQCSNCSWQGLGSQLKQGEMFSELFELDCPACREKVTFIMYPSIQEALANGDRVSDADRAEMEDMQRFWDMCAALELKSLEQLPDIDSPAFTIQWDKEDRMTVLRHGDRVIFTEIALWEGWERCQEVALILKQRYGDALLDLVPTPESEMYLYGDRISSPTWLKKFRQETFGVDVD